jgi:predicted GNAT superfamily acetyltransferase
MRAANARLNLRHLGAIARELLPDLYGRTSSALHHGLATDRLLARWELKSPRVRRLASARGGPAREPDGGPTRRSAQRAARINDVRRVGGLPVSSEPRLDLGAPALVLEIPPDWDAVCRAKAGLAAEWQGVVRRALEACFARGYAAVDLVPAPEGWGVCYLLRRVTPAPSRRAAPGRKTTRSTSRRRDSRAGRRGAARAGRGRR